MMVRRDSTGEVRIGMPTGYMMFAMDKSEQSVVWIKIQEYKAKLKEDLRTKYDGHPNYTDEEDGVFLREQIRICEQIEAKMQVHGYRG